MYVWVQTLRAVEDDLFLAWVTPLRPVRKQRAGAIGIRGSLNSKVKEGPAKGVDKHAVVEKRRASRR